MEGRRAKSGINIQLLELLLDKTNCPKTYYTETQFVPHNCFADLISGLVRNGKGMGVRR